MRKRSHHKLLDVPLHEKIASSLRQCIHSGELAPGDRLPSEADLQATWRASRVPVRQALARLRAEGLIAGGRGRPPVVQPRPVSQPFDTMVSFSSWARLTGRRPGQRTIELARRRADARTALHLGISPGEPYVQLLRVRTLDGVLAMLERTSFTLKYGASLLAWDPDAGSIWAHLIERGLKVGVVEHIIDAVPADQTDHELLDVPRGSPLLRELRTARTIGGEVFESADDRYRPDVVTFTIHNSPDGAAAVARNRPAGEQLAES